ncbi:MAG: hypothetical protein U1E33_03690 [Rhodospirillales bacterium]
MAPRRRPKAWRNEGATGGAFARTTIFVPGFRRRPRLLVRPRLVQRRSQRFLVQAHFGEQPGSKPGDRSSIGFVAGSGSGIMERATVLPEPDDCCATVRKTPLLAQSNPSSSGAHTLCSGAAAPVAADPYPDFDSR